VTRQQALLVGHRQQRLPNAPFSVPDHRIAFSKCGQHGDRQPLESACPVGAFFAPNRLSLQR
jgi:hypothetical protein